MFGKGSFVSRLSVESTSGAEHGSGLQVTYNGLDGIDSLIAGLGSDGTGLDGRDDVRHLGKKKRTPIVNVTFISIQSKILPSRWLSWGLPLEAN